MGRKIKFITDEMWEAIEPLLLKNNSGPKAEGRGVTTASVLREFYGFSGLVLHRQCIDVSVRSGK